MADGGGDADEGEEREAERPDGDAACGGDGVVDAGEHERPSEDEHGDDDRERDRGAGSACARESPKMEPKRTFTPVVPPLAAAPRGRVDGEEQGAEAEDPGEHAADDGVVGSAAGAERGHHERHDNAGGVETDAEVDSGGERGERAGERDVGERVAGEDLLAEHDEVADKPGRERDRGAGDRTRSA